MINDSIYSEIIETKTGWKIPVLKNGKTIESKYNPEREAENIVSQIESNFSFFIVIGVASGILINFIKNKFPESKIIGIETSKSDFDFLSNLNNIQTLLKDNNILFTDINHFESDFLQNYNPVLNGNIRIVENRAWINENQNTYNELKTKISNCINSIQMDYSVQCHFGKIWHKNILNNSFFLSKNSNNSYNFDVSKKVKIIAAGPTLEDSIKTIKENDFIIATDTAFKILEKHNIKTDVVITIDAQFISTTHYSRKIKNQNTLFLLDLSSNQSIARKIKKQSNLSYFISNHPFSVYLSNFFTTKPLFLETGSGTVTIAALDFAVKAGFKEIEILGADFAYSKGKAYAKGSYLEENYSIVSNKINTLETQYDNLLFRTELIKAENSFTTNLLNIYKENLINYCNLNNLKISKNKDIYYIESITSNKIKIASQSINYGKFIEDQKTNNNIIINLPFLAYLKNKPENKEKTLEELCNVAQNILLSYN